MTNIAEIPTDAAATLAYADAHQAPQELEPGRIYLVTDSSGHRHVVDTDDYEAAPRHRQVRVTFDNIASFIAYLSANDSGTTEVWVDRRPDSLTVTALLDAVGWRADRAFLRFTPDPTWKEWLVRSGQLLRQDRFAEFVEDHAEQFASPDGATMLELAESIKGTKKATFRSDKRLANGQRQLEYVEQIEAKAGHAGNIAIPTDITVGLTPYLGGLTYALPAKLRYRISDDGDLALGYKLIRPERVIDKLAADTLTELAHGLDGLPVYQGRPDLGVPPEYTED